MKFIKMMACALMLSVAGAATAGDPFDDARYAIGVKDNAGAIRLIESGEFDINMQNGEGYTLLHFAAGAGNLAMVNALLERGADPSIRNSLGMTALDSAIGTMVSARLRQAMKGGAAPAAGGADFDQVRSLIGAKRNADAIAELNKGIDINMQTSEGFTLLHYAANDSNLEMVRELLRRGANPNIRSQTGHTPADMAYGTMIIAELKKAGGKQVITAPARPAAPVKATPAAPAKKPVRQSSPASTSPHAKMCEARHYSSSALCSDSTCRMREYRKWQTCLKTGSYY
jgi:hypothetical protein